MASFRVDISQIYGGGGNAGATYTNDFIELFNYGTTDVSVSGWSVQYASATGTSWQVTNLTGTIQAGHYYLIQEAVGAGGTTALPAADAAGTIAMSATAGKVALSTSTTPFSGATPTGAVDFVGYGTTANGFEGSGPAPAPSNTTADIRTPSGNDTNDNAKDFTTGTPMPRNTSATGTTQPGPTTVSIGDTTYVEGSGGTMAATFTATRSDTTGSFSLSYGTADGNAKAGTDYTAEMGTLSFAAGGPATQTISVPVAANQNPPANDTFTVNLSDLASTSGSASFGKASATGTIVGPTPIYTIQGSGFTSSLNGQKVTTDGVVTALASNGYYLQDAKGDGNAATSDGLFVFTSSAPAVKVGDFEDVSGTVQQFPAAPTGGAFTTTELASITSTTTISQNNALPAAVIIGPDGVVPPNTSNDAADAFFESLEGMRVTVENPVTIGPDDAAFGEIETFANDGVGDGLNARGDALISLGQVSFGNTDTVGGNFNPGRIEIDGHLTPSGAANYVPDVSLGTHFNNVTGILNYSFGQFGVSSTAPITVAAPSTITRGVSTLVGDATHLTLGSYNIENYTNSGGVTGQGPAKTAQIASDLVNNLKAPDIIALQEVQDNTGPTDGDGVTSASANLQALVDSIKTQSGVQYAYIDNPFIGVDTNGGQPGGNIRDAFLYRPDQVQLVPGSLATIGDINGTAIHDMGSASADAAANKDQQTNNNNPFFASRPPLSATFTFNGQTVTVIDDHFTSKGGSSDLMGTMQPPFDGGEVQRAAQAQAENAYIKGLLSTNPNANIVATGDLNEFDNEEPIKVLEGAASISNYSVPAGASTSTMATATYTAGGTPVLTDLEGTLPAAEQYDYVFQGNAESLVHILSSNALTPNAQFQVVHINSEFADQTSDHDPEVTSFLVAAPVCYAAGTLIRAVKDGLVADVPVESLRAGDLVVTASGVHRPIRWMGHRAYVGRFANANPSVLPVCFKAGSLADSVPARDLWVSPNHAMVLDGLLVPAEALVNGVSVIKATRVVRIEYWHVELDDHDVILAEGAASESYVDDDNRGWFHNRSEHAAAFPDARRVDAAYCLPRVEHGHAIEAIRQRLAARTVIAPDAEAGAA